MQLERYGDAFDVLDQAMAVVSKDGECSRTPPTRTTIGADSTKRSKFSPGPKASPTACACSHANVALDRGDRRLRRRSLPRSDQDRAAANWTRTGWYVNLVAEMERTQQPSITLPRCARAFPHHFGLAQFQFEWLAHKGLARREPILKKMIEIHPANAWMRVEYAYDLSSSMRWKSACPTR